MYPAWMVKAAPHSTQPQHNHNPLQGYHRCCCGDHRQLQAHKQPGRRRKLLAPPTRQRSANSAPNTNVTHGQCLQCVLNCLEQQSAQRAWQQELLRAARTYVGLCLPTGASTTCEHQHVHKTCATPRVRGRCYDLPHAKQLLRHKHLYVNVAQALQCSTAHAPAQKAVTAQQR